MWKKIKKLAGFSRKEPESISANVSPANDTFCYKCNRQLTDKSRVVCNTCLSNTERLLDQSIVANRRLKENIEATEILSKANQRETQAIQTKQLEKIAELSRLLKEQASREAVVSRLYDLVSKAYFEPFGIKSLYYITDQRNLASILSKGIMCKNSVETQGIQYSSFADEGIQTIRSEIFIGDNNAHDYVPLYFEPNPPMLYRLQKEYQKRSNQNELVYVCVRKEILLEDGVFFTDRNLASANCKVCHKIEDLANLKWDVIRDKNWGGDEERKHIKGAEVLVPHCVSPAWFTKIVVYDKAAQRRISSSHETNLPIEENKDEFYY